MGGMHAVFMKPFVFDADSFRAVHIPTSIADCSMLQVHVILCQCVSSFFLHLRPTESFKTNQVSPGLDFRASRTEQFFFFDRKSYRAASGWCSPGFLLTRPCHSCCPRRVAAIVNSSLALALFTIMAPSKKLTKFLKKVLNLSPQGHKPSFSRHSSATTNSFDSSSLGINSGRSWGSMGDIHNGNHSGFHSYDSDVECSSPPADVPAGCLAVYVGKERRRFVIPTSYLSNSVFRALLAKSEEEFGFCCDGGLRIACAPDVFEHLLWWLEGATSEFEETEVVGQDSSR